MAHDGDDKTVEDASIGSKELLALYDEAKEMLNEAAQYFGGAGSLRNLNLSADNTLAYTEGSKCITARLMEIMTWLFVQRAVATGEMSADGALKDDNRLGAVAAPRADPQDPKYGDCRNL
jgi:regulator of CtrA degradation